TDGEAGELLRTRLARARPTATADPALALLLPYCAGLPLALGVLAARATTGGRGTGDLAALAEGLRDGRSRPAAVEAGDGANLRAVVATSVRVLSPPAVRVLGFLGTAPGPEIGLAAAASMAGAEPASVRVLLRELVDASLLTEDPPGRFRMHDLIRLYV